MPLLSIIVPVYKVEKVLHYCVDSILAQTYKDFELILVDDGSPDDSGRLCDEYAQRDSRIKVIHKANGGVSSARNCGIEEAKGDYILFVDSDDFIDNNYFETLVNYKNKYPDYEIWCGFTTVDAYIDYKIGTKTNYSDIDKVSFCSTKEIMTLHEKWLDAGPYCKLYSLKVLIDNNLRFSTELSLGEDLTFNFQYLDKTNGEILVINMQLYYYVNIGDSSLSKKYYDNLFGIYQNINSTMAFYLEKWDCDKEQVTKFYNACFFKYEIILRNTFSEKCDLSERDKFKLNNQIMKSTEFCESLKKSDCFIHPLYRFAYKTKNYRIVRFIDKIVRLRNR